MKKIYVSAITLLLFSFVMAAMVSCKKNGFLSPAAISNLNQSTVFADSSNTNQFLNSIYNQVGLDCNVNEFGNGGMDAAGDESQASSTGPTDANYWASGTINSAIATDNVYTTCYAQIRAVNQLLANISKTRLLLPSPEPGSREELKAEARFLRAWYYAILIKHYGGVSIVYDNLYNYTQIIPVKRASYQACVNYIVQQLDSAAMILPLTQSGNYYGRASAGACMALKARVLLYAASPLFNAGNIDPGNILVGYKNVGDSVAYRWQIARDAAAAVINTNAFALWQGTGKNGFQDLFDQRVTSEYIFQWMLPSSDYGQQLEAYWDPPSRDGANGAFPYEETVETWPMLDGKAITDNTSIFTYDPQHPYDNRDPRLHYSIIYDQTPLLVRAVLGERTPVNIYLTTNQGVTTPSGVDAVGLGTITGYYTNKMLDTNAVSTQFDQATNRCQPLMRYAEVLLNFAEAENEFEGPTDSIYSALEAIRHRAGILPGTTIGHNGEPTFGLNPNMTQDQMRTAIQTERRLELAYEGFRFWDVRRWKIAPTEENKQFHGLKVIHTITTDASGAASDVVTYNPFPVLPVHTFATRMYFWPFPQSELSKSAQLVQNPGY